jgi:hypothetical protein
MFEEFKDFLYLYNLDWTDCLIDKIFKKFEIVATIHNNSVIEHVKCEKYTPVKFANFAVCFSFTDGKLIPLSRKGCQFTVRNTK